MLVIMACASACVRDDWTYDARVDAIAAEVTADVATDVPSTDVPSTDIPSTDIPSIDIPSTDVPVLDASSDVPALDARADAAVDALYRKLCENLEAHLTANPQEVAAGLDMIAVLKNLERVADLATNIAEDVAYTVDGHIIRHPVLARRSAPKS